MRQKQVDKIHYSFSEYVTKQRFSSVWHQLDELLAIKPSKVLEIGPGPGILKALANTFDIKVETLDLDMELKPDYVGSIDSLPFENDAYGAVCAFQVLEHLPYNNALLAFEEMARVSQRYIIISLPDARTIWPYYFHIPRFGGIELFISKPQIFSKNHIFNGEHYWEINKKGYGLKKIMEDFSTICKMVKTYRVKENSYHRFFIFDKTYAGTKQEFQLPI